MLYWAAVRAFDLRWPGVPGPMGIRVTGLGPGPGVNKTYVLSITAGPEEEGPAHPSRIRLSQCVFFGHKKKSPLEKSARRSSFSRSHFSLCVILFGWKTTKLYCA